MRVRHLFTALLAFALIASACGGGDDSGTGTTATSADGAGATTTTTTTPDATTIATTTTTGTVDEPEDPCVLWYTDFSRGTLTRYDLCAAQCVATVQVGESAEEVDVAFGAVWVTDCIGEQLVRVDVATNEVTGRLNLPGCPSAMVLAQDTIWLALPSLPGLWEVDPSTGTVLSEIVTAEPPLTLQIASLWVGFYDMIAWTPDYVHAVGHTYFEHLSPMTHPTEGPVKVIGGDPIFADYTFDEGAERTRITSIAHDGTTMPLADLPGLYSGLVPYDGAFLALAPYENKADVGMTDGPGSYEIPLHAPSSAKKTRDGNGGGNGNPPGRRPPNLPPPGGPGAPPIPPVVIANPACDVWAWPDGSYDAARPLGNCACEWEPGYQLTDAVAATQTRVDAEAAYAGHLEPGAFPMDEPVGAAAADVPHCTSNGLSLRDNGRTIVDPYSMWELDGSPADGLQVALYLASGDWYYPLFSALTDPDGAVLFEGEFTLDDMEGAPPPGSTLTIGQAPVIDGMVLLENACETDADV